MSKPLDPQTIPVIHPGYVYTPRASVFLLCLAAATAGLALGLLINGPSPTEIQPSNADWTIAQCSLWTDTQYPKLPAFTIPGWCVTDQGELSHAGRNRSGARPRNELPPEQGDPHPLSRLLHIRYGPRASGQPPGLLRQPGAGGSIMTDREPTIPLRELIHHGGFIFAMCGLVIFAVLMSLMGLGK